MWNNFNTVFPFLSSFLLFRPPLFSKIKRVASADSGRPSGTLQAEFTDIYLAFLINIIYSHARTQVVDRIRGQGPQTPKRGRRPAEVVADQQAHAPPVRNPGKDRQTMQIEVLPPRPRYHNHLDKSILALDWTAQEEEVLFRLHSEVGNKWSLMSQQLPGR